MYRALAEQDLIDIWVYTADEWNFEQADSYLDELANGIYRLTEHHIQGMRGMTCVRAIEHYQ